MSAQQDVSDVYAGLMAEVLRRHNQGQPEANICSAVRDFILNTDLARPAEINEEESPTEGALTSVDMVVRETFIEFKRNLFAGAVVNPAYIKQLDGYLAEAIDRGRGIKTGILTDGKRWILRWCIGGAGRAGCRGHTGHATATGVGNTAGAHFP